MKLLFLIAALAIIGCAYTLPADKSEFEEEADLETLLSDVESEYGDEADVEYAVESEYGDEADVESDVESEYGDEADVEPNIESEYGDELEAGVDSDVAAGPGYPRLPPRSPRIPSSWCLTRLYVMAFTSGLRNAGSNGVHAIQVYARGLVRTVRFYNRPGNDYYPHKGDLWKINFSSFRFPYCIKVGDIRRISIIAAHNDGWNIDSIVTLVGARGRYNVVTVNLHANRWIDRNGPSAHRRWDLTRY
jgi:hypothetical protein